MNARLLEHFLRAAELGSINKAALELGLSQPALSRNIGLLEHEMGARLLIRSRGGVTLTEAGRLLAEQIRPMLRQFAMLKEQIGGIETGQVAIGLPPSWHQLLTRELVLRVMAEGSHIRLRVIEAVSHVLRDQLASGLLDLCIAPQDTALPEGCVQVPLLREPMVMVGGPDTGLDPGTPVGVAWLAGRALIMPPRPNRIRVAAEHELALRGIPTNTVVEADSLPLCLELAAAGRGVGIMPRGALLDAAAQGCRWAPVAGFHLDWSLFINTNRTHSAAVRFCRARILALLAERIASGEPGGLELL